MIERFVVATTRQCVGNHDDHFRVVCDFMLSTLMGRRLRDVFKVDV